MNGGSQPMLQGTEAPVPNGGLPAGMSMPLLQEGVPAATPDNYQVTPASGVCFTKHCTLPYGVVVFDICFAAQRYLNLVSGCVYMHF